MQLTYQSVTFFIGIAGAIFGVYQYFRKPQEDLEKNFAVSEKTVDGKASLLAQQVQWEKEATEKRFVEMGLRMDTALTLAQNHTHTIDVRLQTFADSQSKRNEEFSNSFTKLFTLLEERLPRK